VSIGRGLPRSFQRGVKEGGLGEVGRLGALPRRLHLRRHHWGGGGTLRYSTPWRGEGLSAASGSGTPDPSQPSDVWTLQSPWKTPPTLGTRNQDQGRHFLIFVRVYSGFVACSLPPLISVASVPIHLSSTLRLAMTLEEGGMLLGSNKGPE